MSRTSSDVKNRCNVNQTCLNCGGDLGRNKYYCSQKCRAEYIRNHKKCVICGKYFYASPSSEKKTCSKACEKIERATIGKIGKSAQNLINAQKAAALSPNSGRFETNAIVTMAEVVEHLYNRECNGKVVIDDKLKAAIDAYYEQYGAK